MSFASNTLTTSTVVAKESLRQLENNLGMAKMISREWENKFGKDGETLGIRKQNVFRTTKARARTNSTLAESSITLTVATQAHVSFEWSTKEMTDTIDRITERYINPALSSIANTIDTDCYDLYVDFYNQVGSPGTSPGGFDVYADARQILNEEAIPLNHRYVIVNPAAEAATLKGLKGLFVEKTVDNIIAQGSLGSLAGFDFYMGQSVAPHTTGAFSTSGSSVPLVDGASQTGDTLLSNGWASATTDLNEGDIFTVAGVYAVNPKTGRSTGSLRRFVVTADIDDTTGAIDIPISPSIVTSGAYQTCSASPANDAVITMIGTESTEYPMNLAFHKEAMTLAMRPLEIPSSVVWGSRQSYNGLSVRVIKDFDIDEDKEVVRFDVLYGLLTQNPSFGCRITG